nr:Histidine kinase-, DNA gyrase B-, and HSP90-like ATPase [uncultured organism]
MPTQLSAPDRLIAQKYDIIKIFEEESRRLVDAARDKDSHIVQNELSDFIDGLVLNLQEQSTELSAKEWISARHHGQERAGIDGYTVVAVIKEYRILRQVIIRFLRTHETSLSDRDREIIHAAVDSAIELAVDEFSKAEQSRVKLALAKAEASNHELDHFAAVAAHDLRSPLNTIGGFASLLRDEYVAAENSQALEFVGYIEKAVGRMTSLIEGILSYAKLNSSPDVMTEVAVADAILSATQNLKSLLTASSAKVGHVSLPTVLGSLPLLSQLFQNLISNSIKFRSPEPPEINVEVTDEGHLWRFCVSDNGEGFDSRFKEDIFALHKQLDTTQRPEGVGIGLATCRRVVEIHGGSIWAESKMGEGTQVYFTLPKRPADSR